MLMDYIYSLASQYFCELWLISKEYISVKKNDFFLFLLGKAVSNYPILFKKVSINFNSILNIFLYIIKELY